MNVFQIKIDLIMCRILSFSLAKHINSESLVQLSQEVIKCKYYNDQGSRTQNALKVFLSMILSMKRIYMYIVHNKFSTTYTYQP